MTLAIAAAITILITLVVVACIEVFREAAEQTSRDPNVIEVPCEPWDGRHIPTFAARNHRADEGGELRNFHNSRSKS